MNRKSQGYLIAMAFRRARSQSTRAMELAESRFIGEARVWGRLDAETLEKLDMASTRLIDAALYPDGSVTLVPRDNSEGHPATHGPQSTSRTSTLSQHLSGVPPLHRQGWKGNMASARLLFGDSREQLKAVESESVDLIVTSPPYANQRAASYGGIKPDDYVDWFMPIADELQRVLKPTGTFVLNIKEPAVNGERHTYVIELVLEMRKRGWLWTEEFAWHKKNCYPGKWPNRFRDAWERLLQFNKQRKFKMNQESVMVPVGDWYDGRMRNLSETDRVRDESKVGSGFGKKVENWLGRDKVYPTNVLHGATECGNRQHSAVFPYWLPEWFIDLFTDPDDVVLDPFAGSGTAVFAALAMGRNAIGVELYEPYFEKMQEQLSQQERLAI